MLLHKLFTLFNTNKKTHITLTPPKTNTTLAPPSLQLSNYLDNIGDYLGDSPERVRGNTSCLTLQDLAILSRIVDQQQTRNRGGTRR